MKYNRTPTIQTLIFRIKNYPNCFDKYIFELKIFINNINDYCVYSIVL